MIGFIRAAHRTRAKSGVEDFPSGDNSLIPGACVPRTADDSSLTCWHAIPFRMRCRCGTASEEPASTTDGQPALASAGLTDQVALCRS